MENVMENGQKSKEHRGRKAPRRKIIIPRQYGILSREDLQKAVEIFKTLRERRAVSK